MSRIKGTQAIFARQHNRRLRSALERVVLVMVAVCGIGAALPASAWMPTI
jgi:hypothetical protein